MRVPLIKVIFSVALVWFAVLTFKDLHHAYDTELADGNRIFALFSRLVLVAVGLGIIFVTTFIPVLGEWFGNYFFNPNERIEEPPDARARAALAEGDYQTAVEEYTRLWEKHSDPEALRSLVAIYREQLNDPGGAAAFLESTLNAKWTNENAAVINALLADIAWTDQRDAPRAHQLLREVIDAMPNSRQAMNAQHFMQKIDRELIAEANKARIADTEGQQVE